VATTTASTGYSSLTRLVIALGQASRSGDPARTPGAMRPLMKLSLDESVVLVSAGPVAGACALAGGRAGHRSSVRLASAVTPDRAWQARRSIPRYSGRLLRGRSAVDRQHQPNWIIAEGCTLSETDLHLRAS
jgi:hypothetical protein